jgi:DNA-binding MarR family transcriptional regulator
MFSYIIDQYSNICKLSYHCFEIYHISALNKLLKGDYSARDFQMLSYIKHSNEFVSPASLKKIFNMNFSALSNRLAVLEKKEILNRTKLDPTSKFITLRLCQHGHEIVDIYDNYATLYLQSLKKSFKLKDTLILTSAIKKINQIIHKESNDDEINKIKGVSSKFLFDVYHYFSNYEIIWLSTVKVANLKQRDFFILSELFVFFFKETTI